MNRSIRTRITAPIAVALAIVLAPALTGCMGNPIESIIEGATGGDVELPGTSLPEGFPTEVPLIEGEVVFGGAFGDGESKVFNATVKVDGMEAFDEIKTQLEDAGFISAANGSAGQGGTGVFTNDNWGVAVVVTDDANGGFLANYTVTNANAA